ncbi:unnamed protein product [Chilo suppressalis]|uniref:OPA3-like protein n=1 Tax=Chilo suppressalis TaxID=168631 RepID=A0ABN8EGK5_CHISP|nr:unnamed protein product [Chilo suppressalis]
MAIDQFPMFRMATLLARQLSSPIASRIKAYAMTHPRMRTAVVCRAGRMFRGAELRFKLWAMRLPPPPRAAPLSDNDAVQVGSDIIGEIIIFTLGAGIVIFEVNRQAEKLEIKMLEERSEWVALLVALQELKHELELQQQEMDRLQDELRRISQRQPSSPPTPPSASPTEPAGTLTEVTRKSRC